jgi:branched-chain amino acid transport system ATP-binding protein
VNPPSTSRPLLELVDVHAGYGGIEILHGINLSVPEGTVMALLGPNGAGKSTTLKTCAGLLSPTRGEVRLAGRVVNGIPAEELARLGVCTIPEGKGIFPNLTVRENLWLDTHVGVPLRHVEEVAYERFPQLRDRARQPAGTLSGGEQQMLAVARALVTKPAVLLVDELSIGLAPLLAAELYRIVARLSEEGVSVLIVEQLARAVLSVADSAAIMAQGRLVAVGRPAEMRTDVVGAYLG